jgi:hypothetical protein
MHERHAASSPDTVLELFFETGGSRVRISSCFVVLALVAATGCGGGHRGHKEEKPSTAPRAEERRDDRKDEAFEDRTGWEKLGERWVNGGNDHDKKDRKADHGKDHDTIVVGKSEGSFRKIMVVSEHSALELFDIEVHFGNGEKFSPNTRLVFDKNTRSRVIDLPGDARVIKKVDFRYANLPGGGKAQLELWAR